MRKGGTESSTNSVADVNRTSGRPPMFDKIEAAEGLGMVVVLMFWLELESIVLVDRRGGFVAVGRARRALGGKARSNCLTRSIASSRRLSLEMHRISSERGLTEETYEEKTCIRARFALSINRTRAPNVSSWTLSSF